MLGLGTKMGLRFLSNLLLTRLLSPEMFGIASLGNAIIAGVEMLSDFGVRQSVIRSHREDAEFLQTAWTVQVARGCALALLIFLLAYPVAAFYDRPSLAGFLFIVAFSNIAMGMNNIHVWKEHRAARLRRIAIIEVAAAFLGLLVMAVWAWYSPTYIALAVGAVASTAFFTLGSFLVFPAGNCRLCFDHEALAELVGFGKWVLISTLLAFATTQMDKLALGKLISLEQLGLYSIAWLWASLPNLLLDRWAVEVFFPLAAHWTRGQEGTDIWRVRQLFVLLLAVCAATVYAVSDLLIGFIYKRDYAGVSPLMRQLAFVALLYSIDQVYSHILIARGRPQDKIAGQMSSVAVFGALLLPAHAMAGIDGVIALLAISATVRIAWQLAKFGRSAWREAVVDLLSLLGAGVVGHLLFAFISSLETVAARLVTAIFLAMIVLGIATLVYRYVLQISRNAE
jgi:O-antigen/teichoic acid export membrane protein